MTTVTIALPDDLLAALHRSPVETQAEVRLAAAVDWYRRGLLSQGRAAEIAGCPARTSSTRLPLAGSR